MGLVDDLAPNTSLQRANAAGIPTEPPIPESRPLESVFGSRFAAVADEAKPAQGEVEGISMQTRVRDHRVILPHFFIGWRLPDWTPQATAWRRQA